MKKAVILDYKVGNINSIGTFLRDNGYRVSLSSDVSEIKNTDLLILPGVGSFKMAAENLGNEKIIQEIKIRHSNKKAILGICLGFQILTNSSSEAPNSNGLGIFHGTTIRLKEYSRIGWGTLTLSEHFDRLKGQYFYFNHSYGSYNITNSSINLQSGLSNYHAIVANEKTVGVQFHPERSQKSGYSFLNWLESSVWNFND